MHPIALIPHYNHGGTLAAVTPAWVTLTGCQAEDGTTIEGDLMVALPLPWVQVIR